MRRFAQLKQWAEFWVDQVESGLVVCCQMTDEDVVAEEAEQFDCSTCAVAQRSEALDGDNQEALTVYRKCCNRFLVDTQSVGVAVERLTEHLDSEEFSEMAERLRILYDTLQPRKTT